MKLDVPHDYVPLLITALEHHYAYTRAVQRDDTRYQQAADWFKRQRTPVSEKPVRTVLRKTIERRKKCPRNATKASALVVPAQKTPQGPLTN